MLDSAFSPALVRGLGLVPPVETPTIEKTPSSPPTGLGALPRGMGIVPPQGQRWLVAYVDGASRPNVSIAGHGFSYKKACDYFTRTYGAQPVFFQFTNSAGTYTFAHERVNGRSVIKAAADGMRPTMAPGRRTVLTPKRAPARPGARGMGQVFAAQPASYANGDLAFIPIGTPVGGHYVEVYPNDPTNQSGGGTEAGGGSNLDDDLSNYMNTISAMAQAAGGAHVYFGISDPHSGAPQTPGEPAGMSVYHAYWNGSDVVISLYNSPVHYMASTSSTSLSVSPGVPTWFQNAWICIGKPASPPPGLTMGSWGVPDRVNNPDLRIWYPTPGIVTQLNGIWVYASPPPAPGLPSTTVPPPTSNPPDGSTGSWSMPYVGYWVWTSTGLAATTDYTWLYVLLGLAGVGTVAYLVL